MSRLTGIITALFFTAAITAQPKIHRQPVIFDKIILPADSISTVYFTYQISFKNLVFTKVGNHYRTGVKLSFEFTEKDLVFKRHAAEESIEVENFEDTKDESKFLKGVTRVLLPNKKFSVKPLIRSLEKFKPIALREFNLNLSPDTLSSTLEPIAARSGNPENGFEIYGFHGAIPYTRENIPILFPVEKRGIESAEITVEQKGKLITKTKISDRFSSDMQIDAADYAGVFPSADGMYTIFVMNNITNKLDEGKVEIVVNAGGVERKFLKEVVWEQKPLSLIDPEGAIKLLKHIVSAEKVDGLLDADEEEYYNVLKRFWKRYDKTNATPFNEVMQEFYQRVDYTRENFGTVNHLDGAMTDRGKIFIKYGTPSDIERDYSSMNNTIEIWHYGNRDFIFADRNGLGNYELIKS